MDLYLDMLRIDSTSGQEGDFVNMLAQRLPTEDSKLTIIPGDHEGEANLLLTWGEPRVVYCTHIDTVPPYIPPTVEALPDGDMLIRGRGSCDAKGQIFAMYCACRELAGRGERGFGLLLLYGEETGSYGAKKMKNYPGAEYVIVGEPTDNKMTVASKGTKAYKVTVRGRACHSGYPEHGVSAVERFVDLVNRLRAVDFPLDPLLGPTTYNIGSVESPNPQNILSPELKCRIYFRTTMASDELVQRVMADFDDANVTIEPLGGDTPSRYFTLPGFDTTTVSFGSDAPHLTHYRHKILCGPGSILVAHTPNEQIKASQLQKAVDNYIKMYLELKEL